MASAHSRCAMHTRPPLHNPPTPPQPATPTPTPSHLWQQLAVLEQLHDDGVAKAKARTRLVLAAKGAQQPVVPPAAADGAQLPRAVKALKHDACRGRWGRRHLVGAAGRGVGWSQGRQRRERLPGHSMPESHAGVACRPPSPPHLCSRPVRAPRWRQTPASLRSRRPPPGRTACAGRPRRRSRHPAAPPAPPRCAASAPAGWRGRGGAGARAAQLSGQRSARH